MIGICYGHGLSKGAIIQTFYHGLDDATQGILDAGGIFLYKNPNESFKILEHKVLLKLNFSEETHIQPYLKIVVSAGGSNIISYHEILMEKIKSLATKVDYEFMNIREELKETRDGRRNDEGYNTSKICMSDDMPMCDSMEANYVQGYHDRKPINSYSYPNHDYPHYFSPPSKYFRISKTYTEEMMKEWMVSQIEANEDMKNPMVELECQINQGLRNRQLINQNLEKQFESLN
ncbi:hypothetical protein Tco_1351480 [Tanacetum coccineum]